MPDQEICRKCQRPISHRLHGVGELELWEYWYCRPGCWYESEERATDVAKLEGILAQMPEGWRLALSEWLDGQKQSNLLQEVLEGSLQ